MGGKKGVESRQQHIKSSLSFLGGIPSPPLPPSSFPPPLGIFFACDGLELVVGGAIGHGVEEEKAVAHTHTHTRCSGTGDGVARRGSFGRERHGAGGGISLQWQKNGLRSLEFNSSGAIFASHKRFRSCNRAQHVENWKTYCVTYMPFISICEKLALQTNDTQKI